MGSKRRACLALTKLPATPTSDADHMKTFTIYIDKQGAGFTVRLDDKVLGYGLSAREARFLSSGAGLTLEKLGHKATAAYCTEYYADPNN